MNLANLIKQGEGETLEFKQSFEKEAIISCVALASKNGGKVLIGVSDKGEVKGVTVGKETLKKWVNEIAQATEPMLSVDISTEKVQGHSVVVIDVPNTKVKPVSAFGRYYLRVANSNRQIPLHRVNEIYMGSVGISWDATPALKASMKDISMKKVKLYIARSIASKRRKFADPPLQTLQKLGYVVNNKPTWSAILLFGNDPTLYLPQAKVHCGRFKGSKIIDDNYIEGDLFDQIDKTMSVIQRSISVEYIITGKKAQRDEVWEYPLDAIREAVVNAICHRDYSDGNEITIKIDDESILIWNPGTLPYSMTMEVFRNPNHTSVPRNKNIARALYDVEAIEHYGSGVKRILDACKASGMPEPEFEEQTAGFNVVFRKAKQEVIATPTQPDTNHPGDFNKDGLNSRQIKVVEYVIKKGKITNREFQTMFEVSASTALRELALLVKKEIFVKKGKTGVSTSYQMRTILKR